MNFVNFYENRIYFSSLFFNICYNLTWIMKINTTDKIPFNARICFNYKVQNTALPHKPQGFCKHSSIKRACGLMLILPLVLTKFNRFINKLPAILSRILTIKNSIKLPS